MPPDPTPPRSNPPLPPPVDLDALCVVCHHRMGNHTRNGYSTVFGHCTILAKSPKGPHSDELVRCDCARFRDPSTILSSNPNPIAPQPLTVTGVEIAEDGQSAKMTLEGDRGDRITHKLQFDRQLGDLLEPDVDPWHQPSGSPVFRPTTGRTPDPVKAPLHYNVHPSGVEVIEITRHLNFCMGNAVKYILRADHKGDPIEDLMKAREYLEFEINTRLGKSPHAPIEDTIWQYQHPAPYDGDELDWLKEQPDAPHPETVSGEGEPLPKQEA